MDANRIIKSRLIELQMEHVFCWETFERICLLLLVFAIACCLLLCCWSRRFSGLHSMAMRSLINIRDLYRNHIQMNWYKLFTQFIYSLDRNRFFFYVRKFAELLKGNFVYLSCESERNSFSVHVIMSSNRNEIECDSRIKSCVFYVKLRNFHSHNIGLDIFLYWLMKNLVKRINSCWSGLI